jgi:hypothetical protein
VSDPSLTVEVARVADAGEVRSITRRLLADGIPATVERDGADHVVLVAPHAVEAAAAVLGLDPTAITPPPAAVGASADDEPPGLDLSTLPPPPEPEPEPEGFEVDLRGFVVVAMTASEPEARTMAGRLLERGIGAEIAPAADAGFADPASDPVDAHIVRVLEGDTDRSIEILGTEPPHRRFEPVGAPDEQADEDGVEVAQPVEGDAEAVASPASPASAAASASPAPRRRHTKAEPEEVNSYLGGRVQLTKRQLVIGIIAYVAALVLIPLAFFYMTRWALDPDEPDPVTTLPGATQPDDF